MTSDSKNSAATNVHDLSFTEPASSTANAASTLSFEKLMNWFGSFTPQCKFKLMEIARSTSAEEFETIAKDAFEVFRLAYYRLSQFPAGASRAKALIEMIETEQNFAAQQPPTHENAMQTTSCSKGCSACCQSFPKQISSDEGQLLAELLKDTQRIDEARTLRIEAKEIHAAIATDQKIKAAAKPCVFLDQAGACSIYSSRPAVCRKYHVTSPPENCDANSTAAVVLKIDLIVELLTSAALSIPGNSRGYMQVQIDQHLHAGQTDLSSTSNTSGSSASSFDQRT